MSQPYVIHTTPKILGSWCHCVNQKNCVKMCCLNPEQQQMADLPLDRVSPDEPPFTYAGVDYFGPFGVKCGKSVVKQYGVIYKWQHLLTQTLSLMKDERLIRCVRKVLNSTLNVQNVDEEGLHTVLCKAEAILNSRPITRAPADIKAHEALTPNDPLLLKTKPSLPLGQFQKEDIYARRRWRQVQYMADLF